MKLKRVYLLLITLLALTAGTVFINSTLGEQAVTVSKVNRPAGSNLATPKPDTNKKVISEIKTECKKESKSLFSRLFSFELPQLPLEDFLLAAQKALVNKLF